jgi:redox-sensitive bicupin YhaK (pirin superfamily)
LSSACRAIYLVVARGAAVVNGAALATRDGAVIMDEPTIRITAEEDAEVEAAKA